MLFQQLAPMKSSQSALEPLELEPLELRLLPELELSLPTTPGDVVSAAAERSARAMKRSLLMASMQVSGFRLCRRVLGVNLTSAILLPKLRVLLFR